ncbi:MAG: transglycosylase SLT domain-containing protein, partial [Sneathiella sp.]|nr:transglycosylase SLT domain-containing protein [Sneathiella sp.]
QEVVRRSAEHVLHLPLPKSKPVSIAKQPRAYSTGLMSTSDWQIYRKAFDYADRNQWDKAIEVASKAKYRVPSKYLQWGWLRRYKGSGSFEEITTFMYDNPSWPYRSTLRRRAEEALINPVSVPRTLAFFADRTPLTGIGMLRYGEALIESGQTEKGEEWIRTGWIKGNISPGIEKIFLTDHKKLLTQKEHEERLNRLLWDRKTYAAERMLKRVGQDQRKLAVARLKLMKKSKGVDGAIRSIPEELQEDPGLVFDRIKWRRRKGIHDGAQELLLQVSADDLPYPEIWWDEREIQARKLLRLGHITQAYRLASEHGLQSGGDFAAAEWLSGWISLRFLQDNKVALDHFIRLYENVSYPISRARGAYWIGRAYDAMRDKQSARYWYEVAAKHPSTFYGQMAQEKIDPSRLTPLPHASNHTRKTAERLGDDERVLIVRHLAELGEGTRTLPFFLKIAEDAKDAEDYVFLGHLAREIGRPDYAVRVAKRASQLGTELPEFSWPVHELVTADAPIEKPLIFAITRQESAFASDAVSHAGARGLMQLMPATARAVSRKLDLSYSKSRLTNDPAYNTMLGSTYLGGLIENYDGSYVLAIASYNAGSSRIRRWIREWGDPRTGDINMIDWIELIPFSETRNYVQRVMENLQVYRHLESKQDVQLVQLMDDLERGFKQR